MAGFSDLLWFIGVVENNLDQRLEGRVQVRAFGIHGTIEQIPTEALPWAIPISGSYDLNSNIPPLNSWVFGFFLDGRDAQQPMILGLIPKQYIEPVNPAKNGYGTLNTVDYELLAQGSRPQDLGQPALSRLSRGEEIEKTYVAELEATRVRGISVPGGDENSSWEEPAIAYKAQYPFNRVIETAGGHSIELDDTPGAERIMIHHISGSYVQIGSNGTTTHKSTNDKYDINEESHHVYIGGKSLVCIEGDAHVYVKGNKYEEILGDYKQVVHGNVELSSGSQMNLNSSDDLQMQAARISAESKVEQFSLKSSKDIRLTSGMGIHLKSGETLNFNSPVMNLKADTFKLVGGESSIYSQNVKIGGGDKISLSASVVAMDDVVKMANGDSDSPSSDVELPVESTGVKMSEPPSKMPNISSVKGSSAGGVRSSGGNAGYASTDGEDLEPISYTSSCSSDLIEEIIKYERFSPKAFWDYKQYSIGYGTKANSPNEVITETEARNRLKSRVSSDRAYVSNYSKKYNYNWNDCQIDALSSFIFNLGSGALSQVTNNGTRTNTEIAAKMLEYNKADGVTLSGLVSRRKSESDWFRNGSGEINTNTESNDQGTLI